MKIDARNGGSITKNRIAPLTTANTIPITATVRLILRSWFIEASIAGSP
jgi:hypothetical protein